MGNHTIIVCEYGWIICGVKTTSSTKSIGLISAAVVRSWRNGKGIGALAKTEYKGDYTLDDIGAVVINASKVLFEIPCEW